MPDRYTESRSIVPVEADAVTLSTPYACRSTHSRTTDGVKAFTHTAQFTLHITLASRLKSSPQRAHQIR